MKRTNPTSAVRTSTILSRLQFSRGGVIWLAVSVFVGSIGWSKSINVIFLLTYFMVCLFVYNGLLALLNVRRIQVKRETIAPIHAGEETITRLIVGNIRRRSATAIVVDRIAGVDASWLVADLAGKSSVSCYARRIFPSRGRFSALLRVSSGYPFGLISIVRNVHSSEVAVLPALGVIDVEGLRRWLFRRAGTNAFSRKILRVTTTDQADVRGVRPYRPGDQIRAIHWRISAHRREFMVREFDSTPTPELVLVIEPWLPASPTPLQLQNLEDALSLAATVAATWSRVYSTGVTVSIAGDPASFRTTTPSDRGIREALNPLASLLGNDAFELLERKHFNRSLSRCARLVVSSRRDSPYASLLSESTGRLFVAISPEEKPRWYQPPSRSDAAKPQLVQVISTS